MSRLLILVVATLATLAVPRLVSADDSDAGDASTEDDGVPLACDGGLCDTTYGAMCDLGRGPQEPPAVLALACAAAALLIVRRKRGIVMSCALLAPIVSANTAMAESPPQDASATSGYARTPVDIVIHDNPPPRRWISIAWNPVPIIALGKVSFDVVVAPLVHHAIVFSPFYATTTTAPLYTFDDAGNATQLPQQRFEGFGGELGYRYYFGEGGLRGFFLGPSFILGFFTATAQDTSQTQYVDYGFAVDVGYQALVANRVVVGAGVGAQYTLTDKSIPNQQFPANVYANAGLRPRLLFSVGWAF
jgi:hypothetical protein